MEVDGICKRGWYSLRSLGVGWVKDPVQWKLILKLESSMRMRINDM